MLALCQCLCSAFCSSAGKLITPLPAVMWGLVPIGCHRRACHLTYKHASETHCDGQTRGRKKSTALQLDVALITASCHLNVWCKLHPVSSDPSHDARYVV